MGGGGWGGGGGARSIIPLYSHDVVRYLFFNNLSVFFQVQTDSVAI